MGGPGALLPYFPWVPAQGLVPSQCLLVEMGSTVLQVFRREVTFEFGVEGEGEDGDMVEEFHLPTSSISKPPSLDISKI